MPRAKKTQTPQSPGLEAGAAYGEVTQNIQAQQAIPLPQKAPVGGGLSSPGSAAPQAPQAPLPVEAARGFTPQITPLMAPGENRPLPTPMIAPTSKQRSGELLQSWAAATGDPIIMSAASQLMGG
jgi:hypothetical protein